jgi:hypothetical protein
LTCKRVRACGNVQVKPMTAGVLLDMGIMNPTNGQTLTIRKKVTSGKMAEILGYMREGLAYVNVMTTQHTSGEVRGQLVVPHCMDGELTGADHYGFTNIMMSPDQQDKSVAIAVQVCLPAKQQHGRALFHFVFFFTYSHFSRIIVPPPSHHGVCECGLLSFLFSGGKNVTCSALDDAGIA